MDVLYCYALKAHNYSVGDGSTYFQIFMEYIDMMYE